jgi:hypothetical protein
MPGILVLGGAASSSENRRNFLANGAFEARRVGRELVNMTSMALGLVTVALLLADCAKIDVVVGLTQPYMG